MIMEVNGISLFYDVLGNGDENLILLHGNNEDSSIFDILSKTLEEKGKYKIYLIDSRNHGRSSKTSSISYMVMGLDVVCFIKKLDLKDVTIIGFSDGAIIGLYLSMRFPSCIKKNILCGLNINPNGLKRSVIKEAQKWLKNKDDINTELMLREPYFTRKELKEIDTPTLLLAGSRDLIRLRHIKMINRYIKDSKLIILEGENHFSYVVHSDKLIEYI